MTPTRIIFAAMLVTLLAGCAGSISKPVVVTALASEQKATLHISDITADAASGIKMSDGDFCLIEQKVRGYIQTQTPNVLAPHDGALKMNIHFTKFDRGNAFARTMLMGLGQIVIEADVSLADPDGKIAAKYKVAKDFSLGGVAGATTTVEDVEDGFAKSVAEIVK